MSSHVNQSASFHSILQFFLNIDGSNKKKLTYYVYNYFKPVSHLIEWKNTSKSNLNFLVHIKRSHVALLCFIMKNIHMVLIELIQH